MTSLSAILENIAKQVTDYDSFFSILEENLIEFTQSLFHKQEDPYGKPWKSPSQITLALRKGVGTQALRDSGKLENSHGLLRTGKKTASFCSTVDSAIVQTLHDGAVIKPKRRMLFLGTIDNSPVFAGSVTIPARPWLPKDGVEPWAPAIKKALDEHNS